MPLGGTKILENNIKTKSVEIQNVTKNEWAIGRHNWYVIFFFKSDLSMYQNTFAFATKEHYRLCNKKIKLYFSKLIPRIYV